MKIKLSNAEFDTDDLTAEEKKQLQESLQDELQKPKGGRLWLPEMGDAYWFFNGDGLPRCYIWHDDKVDNYCFALGNVYRTESEAEEYADVVEALGEVKRYIAEIFPPFKADWNNDNQHKWFVSFRHDSETLTAEWAYSWSSAMIIPYLETEEQCKQLIEAQGDNLKTVIKYYSEL